MNILLSVLILLSACKSKEEPEKPHLIFDKEKWKTTEKDGNYTYREQMLRDLLGSYKWEGVSKDSLVQMLGQPDVIEEGAFVYYYVKKPAFIGTAIEGLTFEIAADNTIKKVRLSDDGWD